MLRLWVPEVFNFSALPGKLTSNCSKNCLYTQVAHSWGHWAGGPIVPLTPPCLWLLGKLLNPMFWCYWGCSWKLTKQSKSQWKKLNYSLFSSSLVFAVVALFFCFAFHGSFIQPLKCKEEKKKEKWKQLYSFLNYTIPFKFEQNVQQDVKIISLKEMPLWEHVILTPNKENPHTYSMAHKILILLTSISMFLEFPMILLSALLVNFWDDLLFLPPPCVLSVTTQV